MVIRVIKHIVVLILIPSFLYALAAFPGAEGMGASSVGGRGGTVYKVTNLNDSGAGSFRAACEASGARIVVFAVSGYIQLQTDLMIDDPYLTIAGQTSPGGICITGSMVWILTHDVVITHMRFRLASDICDASTDCEDYGDAVRIAGTTKDGGTGAYNVVLDHCSLSWGCDETLDIGGWDADGTSGYTHDVVVSRCLIAQGLDDPSYDSGGGETDHSYGINIGSHFQGGRVTNVSLHHNYIAHFRARLPYVVYNGFCDMRNNVVYNWYSRQGSVVDDVEDGSTYNVTRINAISNYHKPGSLHDGGGNMTCGVDASGFNYFGGQSADCMDVREGTGQWYLSGNTGCYGDEVWYGWSKSCSSMENSHAIGFLKAIEDDHAYGFISSEAHATTDIAVTTSTMNDTYRDSVLADCGATKPSRDSVDDGFVTDFSATTGSVLDDIHYSDYPTGWAVYSTTNDNPTDSDSDGMWDTVETTVFGNLSKDGTADTDGDGYYDFEEYLFYLGGYQESESPSTPSIRNGGFRSGGIR